MEGPQLFIGEDESSVVKAAEIWWEGVSVVLVAGLVIARLLLQRLSALRCSAFLFPFVV